MKRIAAILFVILLSAVTAGCRKNPGTDNGPVSSAVFANESSAPAGSLVPQSTDTPAAPSENVPSEEPQNTRSEEPENTDAESTRTDSGKGESDATPHTESKTEPEAPAETPQNGTKMEMRSEDGKFVWTADSQTIIYYHDGKNVTGYEKLLECKTERRAQETVAAYEKLMEKGEASQIEKVVQKGTAVRLIYRKSAFPYTTYQQVKAIYDQIQIANGTQEE